MLNLPSRDAESNKHLTAILTVPYSPCVKFGMTKPEIPLKPIGAQTKL